MNVMLTRNPDNSVNAEPGDEVEVWDGIKWEGGWTVAQVRSRFIDLTFSLDHETVGFQMECHAIRHARGGRGHLRLQVARLRAFIEKEFGKLENFEVLPEGDYKRGATGMAHINRLAAGNALADIDNYEYTEPEA